MVGQSNRRQPAARAVRKLIASDQLGAAGSIGMRSNKARWNSSRERSHTWRRHPLALDMAIPYFDLMRFTPGRESTAMSCDAEPSLEPVFSPGRRERARLDYHGPWLTPPWTLNGSETLRAGGAMGWIMALGRPWRRVAVDEPRVRRGR